MATKTCGYCEDRFDANDMTRVVVKVGSVVPDGPRNAKLLDTKFNYICEGCNDSGDHTFWCYISNEFWDLNEFEAATDSDGDDVAMPVAMAMEMEYDADEGCYLYQDEIAAKDDEDDDEDDDDEDDEDDDEDDEPLPEANMSEVVDFYWQLKDGDRHGVLQLEGGNEVDMPKTLEKKIYHRISEAGADSGDPSVVNVYTRLQLIEEGLLPESYTL